MRLPYPQGSLHLITYLPADDTSLNHFHYLAATALPQNILLSPFPIETQWIEDEDEDEGDEQDEQDEQDQ